MEGDERDFLTRAMKSDDVEAVVERLGFTVQATPIEGPALRAWGLEPSSMANLGRLQLLARSPGFRLVDLRGHAHWSQVRAAMMAMHRAAPEATIIWWWSSPQNWTAAMVEEDRQGRRRVKKLVVDREYPDEVGLMQWLAMAPARRVDGPDCIDVDGWRRHFSEILDQDGVTREFFQRFSRGLDELSSAMLNGPDDAELRHEIALGTLLRVVFLYFLQARGALDGDRRFVMRRFRDAYRENGGDKSCYRAVLRPLFFGALNCPERLRDEAARALGDLPFLNGGLFEPTAAEESHPQLDWDDQIWRNLLEGLFERHRFAVEWSDDGDLSRAVDPEMLGKVFEGLMYGDRRKNSGSFYTPRDVVGEMVNKTLAAWFCDEANLDKSAADALIAGKASSIEAGQRRRAREAMASLTVLDPAVGTGAFLLEVLRVLRRIDVGLDEAEGVVRTPGEHYDRMRRLVHDHLCGVDIQPTAVRLCELRIWLAMLASLPALPAREMPPLPNLSHRLCTGNSLIEPLDWVRFRVRGESTSFSRTSINFERQSVDRLAVLQQAYTRAHGEEKIEIKGALEKARKDVERHLLAARIRNLRQRIEPLNALSESADLFGETDRLDSAQRTEKERLEAELGAIEEAQTDLAVDRRREAAFSFDAHFAPVMARGGFDVIVTNPPWVRTNRIDGATRKLYGARFKSSDHRLWAAAKNLGVRATFGSQVDMAGLFIERSLELLRPGGRLCALVPVKLFRSLHGAALRGILGDHTVEFLEDRSEDEQALFDATTYPSILRVRKEQRPPRKAPPVDISVWRSGGPKRFESTLKNLCVHGGDVREPWMLVQPDVERIFRKMQNASVSLGEVTEMPIRRGVMTGFNRVFLLDADEAARFSEPIQRKYLRWAVQGRDVCANGPKRRRRIIWPVDERGQIASELPPELEDYFEGFRPKLEGRSDYRNGPIWKLFRCHDDIEQPGVVWRDMGEKLEAALIGSDSIPLNTVYYLPAPEVDAARAVLELFHSEPMRAIAFAVAERARGGWRRHFAWVMRMLPVPTAWLDLWRRGETNDLGDPAFIRRAYGLSSTEVQRLTNWRRGTVESPRREVA